MKHDQMLYPLPITSSRHYESNQPPQSLTPLNNEKLYALTALAPSGVLVNVQHEPVRKGKDEQICLNCSNNPQLTAPAVAAHIVYSCGTSLLPHQRQSQSYLLFSSMYCPCPKTYIVLLLPHYHISVVARSAARSIDPIHTIAKQGLENSATSDQRTKTSFLLKEATAKQLTRVFRSLQHTS